jgi:formate--tetrahydrofolate ligase
MMLTMSLPPAIEIARHASLKPIDDIATQMGIPTDLLEPYGSHVAKVSLGAVDALADRPRAKYVVVTAVTRHPWVRARPPPQSDWARPWPVSAVGRRSPSARLPWDRPSESREAPPGRLQPGVPFENLNLHLTGDLHAVTAANNLLAAMIDNHSFTAMP